MLCLKKLHKMSRVLGPLHAFLDPALPWVAFVLGPFKEQTSTGQTLSLSLSACNCFSNKVKKSSQGNKDRDAPLHCSPLNGSWRLRTGTGKNQETPTRSPMEENLSTGAICHNVPFSLVEREIRSGTSRTGAYTHMGFQHCRQGPNTLHHNPSCYRKPTEMLQNRYRTARGSDVILRDHRYFQVCAGEMRNGKRLKTFHDNLECKPAQLDYGGKGE